MSKLKTTYTILGHTFGGPKRAAKSPGLVKSAGSVVDHTLKAFNTGAKAVASGARAVAGASRAVRSGFKSLGTTKTTFHADTGGEHTKQYLPGAAPKPRIQRRQGF